MNPHEVLYEKLIALICILEKKNVPKDLIRFICDSVPLDFSPYLTNTTDFYLKEDSTSCRPGRLQWGMGFGGNQIFLL